VSGNPAHPSADLPAVTAAQMREVDRVMVDELGIELVQMMENAGRSLADLAIARYQPSTCTVLAGPGGNGGGGLVAARHLHNRGMAVHVVVVGKDLDGVPGHQLRILRRMGVPVAAEPPPAALVIDAMIGYSLRGDPAEPLAGWIDWANDQPSPTLALDLPSGLDATTGRVGDPCIVADATLTLALPKVGLRVAPQVAGELFAADISIPPAVYETFDLHLSAPFAAGAIVTVVSVRAGGHFPA
jgi:NAD(P)H-hydrate epimerase